MQSNRSFLSRPASWMLSATLGLGLSAAPILAQSSAEFGYSILGAVPATPVDIVSETAATLSGTDLRTTGGMTIQVFEFTGEQGMPVSIDVMSEDFDAYLFLVGPGFDDVMTDDDSGGACNARLTVFLPGSGTYRVAAGSLGGSTGAYTLRLDGREHPGVQGDCGGGGGGDYVEAMNAMESNGFVDVGSEASADLLLDGPTLLDMGPAAAWDVIGAVGQTVTIDLISEEFDALLYVAGPDISGYMSDDDAGGACNSRIQLTIGSDEPYRIVAMALGEGGGLYTIRVSEETPPVSTDSCF